MIDQVLRRYRLRATPARRSVLALLSARGAAVAVADFESAADADRITVYRTLKTFEERGIIHRVPDASGQAQYALCGEGCGPRAHAHHHAHFRCAGCAQTFCLPEGERPEPVLPEGYRVDEIQVTYQGRCPACA